MSDNRTKPVAYDAEGRPLYAVPQPVDSPPPPTETVSAPSASSHQAAIVAAKNHNSIVTKAAGNDTAGHNFNPALRAQYSNEPDYVHAARKPEPENRDISPENQKRSEDSRQKYPHLNLSAGEFVILDIKRHPIGLFIPIFATSIVMFLLMIVLLVYPSSAVDTPMGMPTLSEIIVPVLLFMLLVGIGGFVAVWVYLQNQFFLTNESVIQEIQHTIFSRHEQTVSLGSIEDASFKQSGILQMIFNYGTIRLSTEGEETTYRFAFVSDPRKQVAILNNAVEDFKNGRPVDLFEN